VVETMTINQVRWTTRDLDVMPEDEWTRREIIDGELFVTRAPHLGHQEAGGNIYFELQGWSRQTGLGRPVLTPGVIFAESDAVIPDVVWVSHARLTLLLDESGHFTGAPELVAEVLSSGATHERRDREAKLKLYSIQGVEEYWIADWQARKLEGYRRQSAQLKLVATLLEGDILTSPLLPGFSCNVSHLF
jgi:Uma2 family endonuclease